MVKKVFVDTNVIIDHLTDRTPFANYSTMIFELHEQKKLKIQISALSINTIYYVSRRIIGDEKTLMLIDKLTEDVEIIGTTKTEVRAAIHSGFKDFEDAMQYSTARTIKNVTSIITRDVKGFRKSEIAVFTPEIFIKTMNHEQ